MATRFQDAATARAPLPFIHPDDMPERYALTGVGNCLAPMIKDGALVVFDKSADIKAGDTVGLIFTRDFAARYGFPGCIKRLTLALPPAHLPPGIAALIVVEQLNPPRQYTFASRDVLAVHKAIGFAERGEDGQTRYRLSQEPPR